MRHTVVSPDTDAEGDGLSAFLSARGRLFGIAYRIVKSAAEAEDIVQDVWIRWQATERRAVRDAAAFLATTTTRLAINVIHSARLRRETSIRPSLCDSVDTNSDPQVKAEQGDALQSAVLTLLEKLSPVARAAYVLREAFGYSYREIARILRLEEANARQLVARARRHLTDVPRVVATSAEQHRFLAAFAATAQDGGLAALESVLVGSAHAWVGGTSGQRPLGRQWPKPLRSPALADGWNSTSQHDAKLEDPSSDEQVVPSRSPTLEPFATDTLLEAELAVRG